VYTKEFGKIKGVIKGVRAPYPQFAGNFEIFTRVNLLFYRKKKTSMDLVTGCEATDFFLPVRKDLERLTYANYFIELLDAVTGDYDPNEKLYQVLYEGLKMLSSGASPKRTGRIFEIKLLDSIGLGITLDHCIRCSGTGSREKYYFNAEEGGIICPNCLQGNDSYFDISPGTVNFIKKIQDITIEKAQQVKVAREVGHEVEKVLRKFIQYHVGRELRSVGFLDEMERKGVLEEKGAER
jgi:DNA repair protein RecO (recombination protein O)